MSVVDTHARNTTDADFAQALDTSLDEFVLWSVPE
jgi:hypothetical protein